MKRNNGCSASRTGLLIPTLFAFAFTLLLQQQSFAQNSTVITGKVTNEKGEPLEAVSVREKSATGGTQTQANGTFSLNTKSSSPTLQFSYVGFATQEISLNGKTSVDVTLRAGNASLNDVVVVAYGTQKKVTLTGSQASISPADFKGQAITRVDQALQGRVPGVQVTNSTGAPGGDVRIRVRGANSINGGNDPLYVIDGFVGGDFSVLNPEDVEGMAVLKDASATAAYGSRGANGVIIITTKKGTAGKTAINFTTRLTGSQVAKTMDKLNAGDYAQMVNEHATAVGTSTVFTDQQVADFKAKGGTDWQDAIYRKPLGQQYLLNLSGGSDKTTYFLSGGLQNLPGIIINSWYKIYQLRSNISTRISDKFTTYMNFYGYIRQSQNTGIITGSYNPVVQSLAWAPTTPLYDNEGNLLRSDPTGSVFVNPVGLTTDNLVKAQNASANLMGGLMYHILPELSLNVQYGMYYVGTENKGYGGPLISSPTNAWRSSYTTLVLQNTNTLNWNHKFAGGHSLDLTGVLEEQTENDDNFSVTVNNLIYPSFMYDNLALGTLQSAGAGPSKWSIFSLFGRANYSFQDKYLLSATLRRDASSRFKGSNQSSYFPSISAGWVLSNEDFLKDNPVVNTLKLRASWGLTGNQGISPYSTYSTYSTTFASLSSTSNTPGVLIANAENPNLKWETTEQKDIGVDAQFWGGDLDFTADYFIKDTRDLLFPVPLPNYTGGGNRTVNVGAVQNKGWEMAVSVTPFRGAFNWTTSLNASLVDNKIKRLVKNGSDTLFPAAANGGVGAGTSTQPEFVMIPGQPMTAIWGLKYLGTWKPKDAAEAATYGNVPGDSHYADINGDGTINSQDFTIVGYGLPKYTVGWNNTFSYKNFDLNIFFQGMFGYDKLDYLYGASMTYAGDFKQPTLVDIKNRYIPGTNETSDIPAFTSTNVNYIQSSRFVEKGGFVRLKNISLSYTLPKKAIRNFVGVRLFLSATNWITFTKYKGMDPESGNIGSNSDTRQNIDYGSYPNAKTITGGVSLNF